MRKMDDMEMAISLKAIKWAWFYTVVFLFIWLLYDQIVSGSFNSMVFILLISQNILRMGIDMYLKPKMNKDEK